MDGQIRDTIVDALIAHLRANPGAAIDDVVTALDDGYGDEWVLRAIRHACVGGLIVNIGGKLTVYDRDLPEDRAAAHRQALTDTRFAELEQLVGTDTARTLRGSAWLRDYETAVAAAALRHAADRYSDWHVSTASDGYPSIAQHGLTPGERLRQRAGTLDPAASGGRA